MGFLTSPGLFAVPLLRLLAVSRPTPQKKKDVVWIGALRQSTPHLSSSGEWGGSPLKNRGAEEQEKQRVLQRSFVTHYVVVLVNRTMNNIVVHWLAQNRFGQAK